MSLPPDPAGSAKSKRPVRSHHRSQNHNDAHAESAPPPSSLRHPLVCNAPAKLVNEQTQLTDLIDILRAAGSFAYDSEFIGELTYIPRLCLIQVATPAHVALVDPLSDMDLTPFWELVADPSVEKIVHAGEQDVEPIFRLINKPPANLFDTQIAGGFIGMGYPLSLSKLVYTVLGAKLVKGLTFTHWDHRPLSDLQLRYAADDVRYLPAIREEMRRRLEARGHAAWASEESASLADPTLYRFDPQKQFMRIRGAGALAPQNLAVLRELTAFRDAFARQTDVPPRSFLRDEVLLELARRPARTLDALSRVRGLPRPVQDEHGDKIIDAINRAFALKPENWPAMHSYEPPPEEKFAGDALWAVVQTLCTGRGIDPTLVTGRQEIGELFRLTRTGEPPTTLSLLTGWRRQAIGEHLLAFLAGQIQINGSWKDGILKTNTAPN